MVMNATLEQADFEGNLKVVKDLKTALRTQPLRYAKGVVLYLFMVPPGRVIHFILCIALS